MGCFQALPLPSSVAGEEEKKRKKKIGEENKTKKMESKKRWKEM
jgi:hypothetical protein